MNALPIEQLVPDIRTWPEEDQVELAEYARAIKARRLGVYTLDDDEREAIDEALAQVDRGQVVHEQTIRDLAQRIR